MKAKKSYGQHFLNNESIASAIADSLQLTDQYASVLEVGPGRGMLTKYLLQKRYETYAVEADKDMVFYLKKHFPELKDKLIHIDFLKLNPKLIFNEDPFALIGNFPYNISSQILFWMINYRSQIPEMVGMFQKEVANRVIAKPGNKTYGVISVLIQAYYDGEFLIDVDKSNFSPPPKVQSGVIRLIRKKQQSIGCDEKFFKKIVKAAFSQRRKMLRNTMKSFVKGDEMLQEDFFKQRPEQLSVQDYVDLTNRIASKL